MKCYFLAYLCKMRMNCEILDLRAFIAVIDFNGFSLAAETLNMSQPALSRRIRSLEEKLGVTLIERTTRHVALTMVGRELYAHARRLVDEFDGCFSSFGTVGALAGQIAIAAVPTAAIHFLPPIVRKFSELYPNVRVRLMDVRSIEGLDAVLRGQVEFGIAVPSSSHPELSFTPVFDDELALACRKDHPLAAADSLTWAEITDYPLIGSQLSENRANRTLLKAGINLNWSHKVIHLSTSLKLVEAGIGMAILPLVSAPDESHPVKVVPLRKPTIRRTIGIVQRRSTRLSPAAAKFREMILENRSLSPA